METKSNSSRPIARITRSKNANENRPPVDLVGELLPRLDRQMGYLFRSAVGRTGRLSDTPMSQADVYRMVGRRAEAARIRTRIGCHGFRATGITEYLRNGGKLEIAQQMANHEPARTTGLYDRI